MGCKIRGIRTSTENITPADPDPSIRWVKIEWVDYGLEETQILDWLNYFGEQAGELTEDVYPNSDSDADPFGKGTYSFKMRLRTDIPQLLPMWGKRIRVYNRGIQKLCSNCFEPTQGATASQRRSRGPDTCSTSWKDTVKFLVTFTGGGVRLLMTNLAQSSKTMRRMKYKNNHQPNNTREHSPKPPAQK